MKPVIGITMLPSIEEKSYKLNINYVKAIEGADGIPIVLALIEDSKAIEKIVSKLDGILIPGGLDVSPLLYEEEPHKKIGITSSKFDQFQIKVIQEAFKQNKPILGICRGLQIINVCFGGSLWQDISSQLKESNINHSQALEIRNEKTHSVYIEKESLLFSFVDRENIYVNSYHHQAIKNIAKDFNVNALSKDGVIEGIENKNKKILAVQWHPEELQAENKEHKNIFINFIRLCSNN